MWSALKVTDHSMSISQLPAVTASVMSVMSKTAQLLERVHPILKIHSSFSCANVDLDTLRRPWPVVPTGVSKAQRSVVSVTDISSHIVDFGWFSPVISHVNRHKTYCYWTKISSEHYTLDRSFCLEDEIWKCRWTLIRMMHLKITMSMHNTHAFFSVTKPTGTTKKATSKKSIPSSVQIFWWILFHSASNSGILLNSLIILYGVI